MKDAFRFASRVLLGLTALQLGCLPGRTTDFAGKAVPRVSWAPDSMPLAQPPDTGLESGAENREALSAREGGAVNQLDQALRKHIEEEEALFGMTPDEKREVRDLKEIEAEVDALSGEQLRTELRRVIVRASEMKRAENIFVLKAYYLGMPARDFFILRRALDAEIFCGAYWDTRMRDWRIDFLAFPASEIYNALGYDARTLYAEILKAAYKELAYFEPFKSLYQSVSEGKKVRMLYMEGGFYDAYCEVCSYKEKSGGYVDFFANRGWSVIKDLSGTDYTANDRFKKIHSKLGSGTKVLLLPFHPLPNLTNDKSTHPLSEL